MASSSRSKDMPTPEGPPSGVVQEGGHAPYSRTGWVRDAMEHLLECEADEAMAGDERHKGVAVDLVVRATVADVVPLQWCHPEDAARHSARMVHGAERGAGHGLRTVMLSTTCRRG